MLINLDQIKIKKRIRVDIGDIVLLKDSLNKYGLFHPIIVNDKFELISGFRRLESAKALGWSTIDVKIIDNPDKKELIERELEENLVRKDFTDSELKDAYQRLSRLQNPGIFYKILTACKNFIKKMIKKND